MDRQGPAVTLVVAPVAPRATLFSSPHPEPGRKGSREKHKGPARHGNVGVVKILDRDT
jgi:hypothetical protein